MSFPMSNTGTLYVPSRRSLTRLAILRVRQPGTPGRRALDLVDERAQRRPNHSVFTASGSSILVLASPVAIVWLSSRSALSVS